MIKNGIIGQNVTHEWLDRSKGVGDSFPIEAQKRKKKTQKNSDWWVGLAKEWLIEVCMCVCVCSIGRVASARVLFG